MLGSVLPHNLVIRVQQLPTLLIGEWWLMPFFIIISLILLWRHTTLAYGDMKIKKGWGMIGVIILLLYIPYLFGVTTGNTAHFELFLVILAMDRFVSSISIRRSPFFIYDIGLLIGLLSMLHPAYLILAPYFIIKFYQVESSSIAHVLAQLLGTATVWVLYIFIFAEPNIESILNSLSQKISPLLYPTIPDLPDLPDLLVLIALIILITSTMGIFYSTYRNSISRVRFLYRSHIKFAWLLIPIQLLYGMGNETSSLSLALLILVFTTSPALYFCSTTKDKNRLTLLYLMLSLLFFIATYGRSIYITDHLN